MANTVKAIKKKKKESLSNLLKGLSPDAGTTLALVTMLLLSNYCLYFKHQIEVYLVK